MEAQKLESDSIFSHNWCQFWVDCSSIAY